MTLLGVIRHGPTPWTDQKKLQGRTDVPLSISGRIEVGRWRLPECLIGARCETSPLRRARETAALLQSSTPFVEPRLIEMDWGVWEGQRLDDLRADPDLDMAANEARGVDFRPPGGESPREVQARLRPWMARLARSPSPVLAVTHKTLIHALLALATGWDLVGRPPVRVRWGRLQLFRLAPESHISVERLDIVCAPR